MCFQNVVNNFFKNLSNCSNGALFLITLPIVLDMWEKKQQNHTYFDRDLSH